MRLPRSLGSSFWVAVVTLVLPLAQAQAQECVEFQGLNHCGLGSASPVLEGEELRVEGGDQSGQDGVVIHTGMATHWTAALFSEGSGEPSQTTVLTSVSEGAPTSTATLATEGEETSYAATFTGAGDESTYSALIYREGVLQAAIGGIRSGEIGVRVPNVPSGPPNCRSYYQTYNQCMQVCQSNGWNCGYCSRPCANSFTVTPRGACQWTLAPAHSEVMLMDGRVVAGDEIVLHEEVQGPSSYPYLGFDQIHIQSTATSLTIASESVISACQ